MIDPAPRLHPPAPHTMDEVVAGFGDPPSGFGPVGFWFINDDLATDELLGQVDAFADAGFAALCPCARIGLGRSPGYLTADWFALIIAIVSRAEARGLRIVLYDEASYPSGSANGAVVAENPEFAARCLRLAHVDVTLADEVVHARVPLGRSLWNRRVATLVGRVADGVVVAGSVHVVTPDVHGLVRLDPSEEGRGTVRVMVLVDAPTGGRIRGAHAWQDDDSPLAPAAANLLDPAAVASFLRHTHEAYASAVGAWFGSTVVALFTDEPDMVGRGARPGARPWAAGLLDDLALAMDLPREEVLVALPAVFTDDDGTGITAALDAVTAERLSRVYYAAQRDWCDAHGIALTGHPHEPDELLAQTRFTWPGQDAVWRWVLPGDSAIHGRESASARTAASVAAQQGTSTVVTEVFGAYGWGLSLDEVKWLLDWHLVRGTTAFLLHALFSSVRDNRAYESEPDLGLHNAWWPHLPQILTYLRRMTYVLTASREDCDVAVVVTADRAATDEVADLYRAGIPFAYVADADVRPDPDGVRVGRCVYRTLLVDDPADGRWQEAVSSEVRVMRLDGAARVLDGPFAGVHPDLRVGARRLGDERVWVLTNEGEDMIEVPVSGTGSAWDAWTGRIDTVHDRLILPRRASVLLTRTVGDGTAPRVEGDGEVALTNWESDATPLGVDWSRVREFETWSGAVRYRAGFHLDRTRPLLLDLGRVGEAASVEINGHPVAHLFWEPYRCVVAAGHLLVGDNTLEVLVTNSSANTYEGAGRASGLLGPVTLRG